jgi:hypothetical protein
MAFALRELLWVGALPFCVAALAMLLSNRLGLPARAARAKSVGGGYVVGQFALAARVSWPAGFSSLLQPREAGDWLPWLVIAAIGITVLAACAPRPWQRWIVALAVLLAVVAPVRMLAGSVYVGRWSVVTKLAAIACWAPALAIVWTLLAMGRANAQPRLRGGLLIVVAIGLAVALTLAGSFTYGELCGVMAAALTGSLVTCSLTPNSPRRVADADLGLSGAAGAVAMALGGLILLGYFYAELTTGSAILLLAALVAAGGRLPTGWSLGPIGQTALRAGLCLVPLALALTLTWAAMQAEHSGPY